MMASPYPTAAFSSEPPGGSGGGAGASSCQIWWFFQNSHAPPAEGLKHLQQGLRRRDQQRAQR